MSKRVVFLALAVPLAASPCLANARPLAHPARTSRPAAPPPHEVSDPAALWLALAAAEQGRPHARVEQRDLAPPPPSALQAASHETRTGPGLSLAGAERRRAITCLAAAIHYEAANQPLEGQEAVAQVILNRVNMPGYPKSVCGVVFQGAERRTGCQFTFTCDGSMARRPTAASIRRAEAVAERVLDGQGSNVVGPATNYHTVWVHPYWSGSLVRISQVGAHIFYRPHGQDAWRTGLGPAYAGGELAVQKASLLDGRFGDAQAPLALTTVADARPVSGGQFSIWGISVADLNRPAPSTQRLAAIERVAADRDAQIRNGW